MKITGIELANFRNHKHFVCKDIGSVFIIVGDNASGKTNIIEALQLLSMHESFRRPKNEELLYNSRKKGEPSFISIEATSSDITHTKQIRFEEGNRVFFYNKKERPAKDILDTIPAVLFTPDDLQIVKGPPEQRRDMIDSLGARISLTFSHIRNEYKKAIRHKNSFLKQEEIDVTLLDSWNINIARLGSSLKKHRLGLFNQLIKTACTAYEKISGGEQLQGHYHAQWEEDYPGMDLFEIFSLQRDEEIAAKRSLIGPHKDDILFAIDGQDARRFASQGQQRSLALSLKIAEVETLKRLGGKAPLLLLDDVMSELDTQRRRYFIDLIEKSTQTVITTTNLGYFDTEFLKRATIMELGATAGAE